MLVDYLQSFSRKLIDVKLEKKIEQKEIIGEETMVVFKLRRMSETLTELRYEQRDDETLGLGMRRTFL